jgi:hypothetical protein
VQGVGSELGGMTLGGAEPTQLGGYLARADTRGAEQGPSMQHADGGAAGRNGGSTTAGVEPGVDDCAVGAVGVDRERDANQVSACGAAGGACEGVVRTVAASTWRFEMV